MAMTTTTNDIAGLMFTVTTTQVPIINAPKEEDFYPFFIACLNDRTGHCVQQLTHNRSRVYQIQELMDGFSDTYFYDENQMPHHFNGYSYNVMKKLVERFQPTYTGILQSMTKEEGEQLVKAIAIYGYINRKAIPVGYTIENALNLVLDSMVRALKYL